MDFFIIVLVNRQQWWFGKSMYIVNRDHIMVFGTITNMAINNVNNTVDNSLTHFKYQDRVCSKPLPYRFLVSVLNISLVFDFCIAAVSLFHSNIPT